MHAVIGSTIPGTGGGGSDGGPKPGDLIADRYQIERFIGRGGMAEVFAGLNVRTGKRVALKWIRPALAATTEALARFRREAVAAGRIHHPNVVTVFDVVEHQSATWLVMELLEGETLSEILNRVERMNAEEAVMLLIPAMRGVAAAHAHGVVHRDLKPDNIFICRGTDGQRREAKVLDFGVSKLSDEAGGDQVSITVTGNLVGTPTYMAPEQVRGNKVVDPRSDVYSLGVVLYQMLAGRPPFQGQIYSALMIEIATTDPPALRTLRPDLSAELAAIVHKAMARDLDRRYADVTSFVHALEGLMGIESGYVSTRMQALHSEQIDVPQHHHSERAEETHTLELDQRRVRRTRMIVISVGAVILAGIGIKMVSGSRSNRALKDLAERSARIETTPSTSGAPSSAPAAPGRSAAEQPASGTAYVPPGVPGGTASPSRGAAMDPRPPAGPAMPGAPGKNRGHLKLAVSKSDKTTEKAVAGSPEAPRVQPQPAAAPNETPSPKTRAGRLTIDDF
jgi:serine/threonine protein kinase